MNAETRQVVEAELKRFAVDLNLSDEQKAQLKTGLETAREKLDEAREKNPTSREPMYSRSSWPSVALYVSVW